MRLRRVLLRVGLLLVGAGLAVGAVNAWVYFRGKALEVTVETAPEAQTILVLGALVFPDGSVSGMLQDRLETAIDLYRSGKAPKILVSGDHGHPEYDEVNTMRRYLEANGIPAADIFMDHAGFDTYNSMYRARDVFGVQQVLVVTQRFHLPRALYVARSLGLNARGVVADRHAFRTAQYEIREMAARPKAFWEVLLRSRPVFLGPSIAITGDGRVTHDLPDL